MRENDSGRRRVVGKLNGYQGGVTAVDAFVVIVRVRRVRAYIVEILTHHRSRQSVRVGHRVERRTALRETVPVKDSQPKTDGAAVQLGRTVFQPHPNSIARRTRTHRRNGECAKCRGGGLIAGPDDACDIAAAAAIGKKSLDGVRHVFTGSKHIAEATQITVVIGDNSGFDRTASCLTQKRHDAGRHALDGLRTTLDFLDEYAWG